MGRNLICNSLPGTDWPGVVLSLSADWSGGRPESLLGEASTSGEDGGEEAKPKKPSPSEYSTLSSYSMLDGLESLLGGAFTGV